MTNFPWKDWGREFEDWFEENYKNRISNYPNTIKYIIKDIARDAWNKGILVSHGLDKVEK